ncbi:MAG: Druantia anti-phage system protein DruA [Gammaproteobacteria bacterium]
MEPILFRYRGRDLSASDIALIRATITAHYPRGRSFIAQVLCEHWDWRQPNGAYKGFAARDLLLRLEEAGHIVLPPPQRVKINRSEPRFDHTPRYDDCPLSGGVGDYPPPRIVEAHDADRTLWDYLVHHYHYLGRPKLVGEHIKQLVYLGDQVVGCLGWASAAWKSAPRERWIGWGVAEKRARLHLLTNNVRFLLLPWVRVEHLASKVLGMSVRRLSRSWEARYGHPVVLAETFVDLARFKGTCYRAANWCYVGTTQGHAKRGNAYPRHGVAKALYLYPLQRAFRETLTAL